jgi:hypothetical protein
MFKLIVLICSVSVSPSNCNEQTAKQQLETPEFSNSLDCQTQFEPWLAKIAIKPIPGKEYPKTVCQRVNKP